MNPFCTISPMEREIGTNHLTMYAKRDLVLARIVVLRGLVERISDYELIAHFSSTYGVYGNHTHDFFYDDPEHTPLAHRAWLMSEGHEVHFFIRKKCPETTRIYETESSRCLALQGDLEAASVARPGELAITMLDLGFPCLDFVPKGPTIFPRPRYLSFSGLGYGELLAEALDEFGYPLGKFICRRATRQDTDQGLARAENQLIRVAVATLDRPLPVEAVARARAYQSGL
jgi:hypothetical protein